MTDREDTLDSDKIVSDTEEGKSWTCLGRTCFRSLIVFSSNFFFILLITFGFFLRDHLSKNVTNQLFRWESWVV